MTDPQPSPPPLAASVTTTPTAQIFAIYDARSRMILQFTTSFVSPDLSTHPDWAVRPIPAMPSGSACGYAFDADFAINPRVPELLDLRRAKDAAARAHFDDLISAGFSHAGTRYQIDSTSQSHIAALSLLALGCVTDPQNSAWLTDIYWVAADNSHVSMDAPAMYGFGRAVAGYVSASLLRFRAIKDAIAAAPDQAALDAVDVTAGYPPAQS